MSLIKKFFYPSLNLSSIQEEEYQKTNKSKMYNRIKQNNLIMPPISSHIKSLTKQMKSQSCEEIIPTSHHLKIEALNSLYLPSFHSSRKSHKDILLNKEANFDYLTDNYKGSKVKNEHKKELALIHLNQPNKLFIDKGFVNKHTNNIIINKKKKLFPLKISQYLNNKVCFIPGTFTVLRNNSVSSYGTKSLLKQLDHGKYIWMNKGKHEYLFDNVSIK